MNTDPKNKRMDDAADTGKTVHLSASAGSGKTRALKERYIALIELLDRSGLGMDQAVAITFTDKAAAEIKERVIRDLPEAALKEVIRGRQDLRISTIHSFCMNLLKRYPLEAGLPPDFGVLDGRDQAAKIRAAVESAVEELDRVPEIMEPLWYYTVDDLVEIISHMLLFRSRLERMEIDAAGPEGLIASIRRGVRIEEDEAKIKALISSPDWRAAFLQMELLLRSQGDHYEECGGPAHAYLAGEKDPFSAFGIAESLMQVYFTQKDEPRKKPFISKTNYKKSVNFPYPAYETLYSVVQDLMHRLLSTHRRVQAGIEALSMTRLYLAAGEKYQVSKLREGLLDFDDLEIFAYRLLKSAETTDILYWLDRKILHYLVDEFQDTSDIQWAVLGKLTEEIFAGQGADKPMPSTLFVVGDEKQSIYRFREANHRLIRDVREKIEAHVPAGARKMLSLENNYRSAPEIIETVNRVFTALWPESYRPSETERKHHKGSVRLIGIMPADQDLASSGAAEAEVLAREIKTLVEAKTHVYERPGDSRSHGNEAEKRLDWATRPAGYGDCAVLIQSRTRLKEYEAALQSHGVPFRVVGGIGFYEENEIRAIMNVLFFLWNRDDKLSLAAALKSPLFGLSDRDIMDLCLQGEDMAGALRRLRPEKWGLMHEWINIAGLVPLSVLIHRIVMDTGAYVAFGRMNPQAIFNIDKLLDTAAEFDRRGYTMLQDFVEWVRNIRETEQREAAADMNLPGFKGSVSIMTVHKAKGLEFPVVFLPGMNQSGRSLTNGPYALMEETDGALRMAVKNKTNPLYDELWEREKEELRQERRRLLYVAMTRARDRLVMIGELGRGRSPVKQNTWLECLHESMPLPEIDIEAVGPYALIYSHPEWHAQKYAIERPAGRQADKKAEPPAVDAEAVLKNLAPIPRSGRFEWKKATDFVEQPEEERLPAAPSADLVSPLVRGAVLHRCLEQYAGTGAYDLDGIIREFPDIEITDSEAVKKFRSDAEAIMQNIISDRGLAWIFEQGPAAYSELPFLLRKDGDIVSGIIDRLVVRGSRGFVIDYKAIFIDSEESLRRWTEHYKPQIRIYCEAVKEMFRHEAVEGMLLFLDSGRLEGVVSL